MRPGSPGFLQWTLPFGAVSAVNWLALVAERRMHEFGLTREQLGQIAVNARRNAGDNPKAVYRDPMTLDDYLAARMISTPLCLFDCDAPSDGSTALVVSHRDYAPDTPHPACHVNAVGTALRGRPSWDQFDDPTTMAARDAAASMWERTDLRPSDVDVAQLYDGFSILAMVWLEALGFCGRGESGSFVEGGSAIARDGVLPLNTAGGQLSGGRLHGFGLIHEACVQLRGQGGDRQVLRGGGVYPRWQRSATAVGPSPGPSCSPGDRAEGGRAIAPRRCPAGPTEGQTRRCAARAARAARVSVGP